MELIVVIVILAILAAILIPGLLKWIDEAKNKQYELEARSIALAGEALVANWLAEGYIDSTNLEDMSLEIGVRDEKGSIIDSDSINYISELSGLNVIWMDVCYWEGKFMPSMQFQSNDKKKIHANIDNGEITILQIIDENGSWDPYI